MNRLFFRPEQSGMTKTDAAAQTLASINPDVALESYTINITTLQGFDGFKASLTYGSGASRVDLVLSCVDNYEARMTINQVPNILHLHHMIHCLSLNCKTRKRSLHLTSLCPTVAEYVFQDVSLCWMFLLQLKPVRGPSWCLLLCRCAWS